MKIVTNLDVQITVQDSHKSGGTNNSSSSFLQSEFELANMSEKILKLKIVIILNINFRVIK